MSSDGNAPPARNICLHGSISRSHVSKSSLFDACEPVSFLLVFVMQSLVELSDGSAVAVTVAKYQTPAGVDINKASKGFEARLDGCTLFGWAVVSGCPNTCGSGHQQGKQGFF